MVSPVMSPRGGIPSRERERMLCIRSVHSQRNGSNLFTPLGSKEKDPKTCTRGIYSQKEKPKQEDQLLWQGSEGYLYEMEFIEDKCQQ